MRVQVTLIAITIALTGVSFYDATYLVPQIMQHIPVVPLLGILVWCAIRGTFSHTAFVGIIVFLWLHILGARWTYSNVPYDDWSSALFGVTISETLGWSRNHYDRLVHLLFGVLWTKAFVELARPAMSSRFWQALFAIFAVGAISALYEIAEWVLTMFMSPINVERYNGQQGDMWDPQKDMILAIVGSVVVVVMMNTTLRRAPADH